MATIDLFGPTVWPTGHKQPLCEGTVVLHGFARPDDKALLQAIDATVAQAPFRNFLTPGGRRMAVAMTNAGTLGWVSDHRGYRYEPLDPASGKPWPSMPQAFADLAASAAAHAGFPGFMPDACLINHYTTGVRLSLHQDRDEQDMGQPIVSVSLGVPALFQFGGLLRSEPVQRIALTHGDVVVWGGPARLRYHGVLPLKPGHHPALGDCRINLTFRRAG